MDKVFFAIIIVMHGKIIVNGAYPRTLHYQDMVSHALASYVSLRKVVAVKETGLRGIIALDAYHKWPGKGEKSYICLRRCLSCNKMHHIAPSQLLARKLDSVSIRHPPSIAGIQSR